MVLLEKYEIFSLIRPNRPANQTTATSADGAIGTVAKAGSTHTDGSFVILVKFGTVRAAITKARAGCRSLGPALSV